MVSSDRTSIVTEGALQHAMVEALSLPSDQAEAMRQAGRQHVAGRFDINRTVDTWLSVYGGIY